MHALAFASGEAPVKRKAIRMNRWSILVALGAAAAAGCLNGCNNTEKTPGPAPAQSSAAPYTSTAPSAVATATAASTSGMTPAELAEYYHLPEGGELIPLDMMRAVESVKTFKPFMEDL